jgi:2-polyprenyl-3-methyl-5-hydroxy-6-metoxy-1,4-benzoquinol methylase
MTIDKETLIARFLESDTHSTLQLIAPAETLNKITSLLENLKIKKIKHTQLSQTINNL